MCDIQDKEKPWTQKERPIRETLKAGMPNVVHNHIVSREKIVFPHSTKTWLDKAVCEGTGL